MPTQSYATQTKWGIIYTVTKEGENVKKSNKKLLVRPPKSLSNKPTRTLTKSVDGLTPAKVEGIYRWK